MFGFCSKRRTEGLAKREKRVHNKCAFGRELEQNKNLRLSSGGIAVRLPRKKFLVCGYRKRKDLASNRRKGSTGESLDEIKFR
jgi:hypothetical protein